MRTRLELSPDVDVPTWERRHAAGLVPDRWPYGLHHLADHDVEVAVRRPGTSPAGRRIARGLKHRLGGFDWWDARSSARGHDAVLCWDEYSGVPAVLRERGRRPVVTGVVWLADEVGAATARWARRAMPRADRVWVSSEAMLPALVERWGVSVKRARHVPLGIDADFYTPGGEAEPGLVVSAGNDRHRDHDLLARAVSDVPGATLRVATRLPMADDAAAVRGLGAAGVRDLYRRACVVAVATTPNLHASGLTVTLEGMASGRPVVVPDTPGLAQHVEHGVTGLVYPVGDHDVLAAHLRALLADPAMAAAMGAAGRARVEAEHTTALQAARLADLLHEV